MDTIRVQSAGFMAALGRTRRDPDRGETIVEEFIRDFCWLPQGARPYK